MNETIMSIVLGVVMALFFAFDIGCAVLQHEKQKKRLDEQKRRG